MSKDDKKLHAISLVLDPPNDFPGIEENHDFVTLHVESASLEALEWLRIHLGAHILTEMVDKPRSED